MIATSPKRKAIALISGGLDSALAAKVVFDQGIDVIGLHLLSPFGCKEDVQKCADAIGIPLLIKEKGAAYLDLVENPRYGYGSAMNPCIDCRIFMFQLADVVRHEQGADFIVTGEVLGQRPMSQHRHALDLIENKSPLKGLVLRPLSAHCLTPSIPETEGWVRREDLFHISGRGRREQVALAAKLNVTQHSQPGGGCLLTETGFAPKLKDFFKFPMYQCESERTAQSELLRYGRHFRISEKTKVILGRNQDENQTLESLWKRTNGMLFSPKGFSGPTAIALGEVGPSERETVGKLISRFGKSQHNAGATIAFGSANSDPDSVTELLPIPQPLSDDLVEKWRL